MTAKGDTGRFLTTIFNAKLLYKKNDTCNICNTTLNRFQTPTTLLQQIDCHVITRYRFFAQQFCVKNRPV